MKIINSNIIYSMEIENKPILETLKQMYITMEIKEFMKNRRNTNVSKQ